MYDKLAEVGRSLVAIQKQTQLTQDQSLSFSLIDELYRYMFLIVLQKKKTMHMYISLVPGLPALSAIIA